MDENNNPWKILKSEFVFESPWISLTAHDVLNPSGNPGTYSVVHFKNLAIGILPLDQDNNTWIVGQYRFPLGKYSWEIPEGGGKLDEPPLATAQRELLEETGIKAEQWDELLRMHLSNSVSDELAIVYIARKLTFHQSQPEDTEQLVIKKIPFEELYQMVVNGEVTDSLSVAAVLKVKIMLMQEAELKGGKDIY